MSRAVAMSRAGKLKECVAEFERGVEFDRRLFGTNSLQVLNDLKFLGNMHESLQQYKQALKCATEILQIRTRRYGASHWTTTSARYGVQNVKKLLSSSPADRAAIRRVYVLSAQVDALLKRRDSRKALPLAREAVQLARKSLGEMHPQFGVCLNNLAMACRNQRDYIEAEPLYKKSGRVLKKAMGENHPLYATSLTNLAAMYEAQGDYAQAEPLYEQALEIHRRTMGENNANLAVHLSNLAHVYKARGKYAQAEPLYKRTLEIRGRLQGKTHADYADGLNDLATLYFSMGRYSDAERLFQQSLDITQRSRGANHLTCGITLGNLGDVYKAMHEYAKAETHYRRALAIHERNHDTNRNIYSIGLRNLGSVYSATGQYAKAEPLFRRALEITKRVQGVNHSTYASCLSQLSRLYSSMGDYKQAESYSRRALKIWKKTLGENHPDYAKELNNLALTIGLTGDYDKAATLHLQVLAIRKKVLGTSHADYATSLNNIGAVLANAGDLTKAKAFYQRSIAVERKLHREWHPNYAYSLDNLAVIHTLEGDVEKALPLAKESLAILKKRVGQKHPDYAVSLVNLAAIYASVGRYADAEPLQRQALEVNYRNLNLALAIQSERQQLLMSGMLRATLRSYLDIAARAGRPASEIYEHVLKWKGMITARQVTGRQLEDDPQIRKLYLRIRQLSKSLATVSLSTPSPLQRKARQDRIEQLTKRLEEAERELATRSAAFRKLRKETELATRQLVAVLPPTAALIDFVECSHRRRSKKNRLHTERRLVAFVIQRDKPVRLIPLGSVTDMEKNVAAWRQLIIGGSGTAADAASPPQRLRKQLWQPLEQYLTGVETVLISPDRVLTRIPIASLPGHKPGTYLLHDYAITMMPVPQMLPGLMAQNSSSNTSHSLLLVGGVDFGASPGSLQVASSSGNQTKQLIRSAPRQGKLQFSELQGTLTETTEIVNLHKSRFPKGTRTLLDKQKATESAFRTMASEYRYLHLATHGFFAPPSIRAASAERQDVTLSADKLNGYHPGLLSGVVLAGANKGAKVSEDFSKIGDDGILTALEVAALDLQNVDLVVLSACETGLGKVAAGEGVLGLQRAFQVAGARSTVTSLWKVDDAATQELMTEFYRNLWERKLSRIESLRQAQLTMLKRWDPANKKLQPRGFKIKGKPKGRQPGDPYFWAAFQLSGDWR